ncbi:hypothetical protein E6C60_1815 [Paenibacillus algicola]|uniref:Uncharacterized protein n=1 Tax=Paenibacillus algicola TaxID=2565926 RepID=A0A4P8XLJ7_9BACL|nr:hypothetical protein E6C60_1815 [Paenibacillus algicola]
MIGNGYHPIAPTSLSAKYLRIAQGTYTRRFTPAIGSLRSM